MRAVILALIMTCLLASPAAAKKEAHEETGEELEPPISVEEATKEIPSPDAPWGGVDVDVLGGVFSTRAPSSITYAVPDRFAGVRVAYRKRISALRVGAEGAWRSTAPTWETGLPGPLAIFSTIGGNFQSLRQTNQISAGGTAGLVLNHRLGWFLEPIAVGGAAASMRTFSVRVEQSPPLFKGFPTFGGYAGVGFVTGYRPLVFRMDALLGAEVGPPPFTARYVFGQYAVSLGVRF
jgi:hypothetical protein